MLKESRIRSFARCAVVLTATVLGSLFSTYSQADFFSEGPKWVSIFGIENALNLSSYYWNYDYHDSYYYFRERGLDKVLKRDLKTLQDKLSLGGKELYFNVAGEYDIQLCLIWALTDLIKTNPEVIGKLEKVLSEDPTFLSKSVYSLYPVHALKAFLGVGWVMSNVFLKGIKREFLLQLSDDSSPKTEGGKVLDKRRKNQEYWQRIRKDLEVFVDLVIREIRPALDQLDSDGKYKVKRGEFPAATWFEKSELAKRLLETRYRTPYINSVSFELIINDLISGEQRELAQKVADAIYGDHVYLKDRFDEVLSFSKGLSYSPGVHILNEEKAKKAARTGLIPMDFTREWWWQGGSSFAEIDFRNSVSMASFMYKKDFKRHLQWVVPSSNAVLPDLNVVRVATNLSLGGKPLSLEMMVNDSKEGWTPYFFTAKGSFWARQTQIEGQPVKSVCLRCHRTSDGNVSPRPIFLSTEQDFKRVGYKHEQLIQELMKF